MKRLPPLTRSRVSLETSSSAARSAVMCSSSFSAASKLTMREAVVAGEDDRQTARRACGDGNCAPS